MRIRVPHENKTCFDCQQATDKGKFSVFCKQKGISIYASNEQYMRCKYEEAKERLTND